MYGESLNRLFSCCYFVKTYIIQQLYGLQTRITTQEDPAMSQLFSVEAMVDLNLPSTSNIPRICTISYEPSTTRSTPEVDQPGRLSNLIVSLVDSQSLP